MKGLRSLFLIFLKPWAQRKMAKKKYYFRCFIEVLVVLKQLTNYVFI